MNRSSNGNGNPLAAVGEGARLPVPMNMWGDPQIETAVRAFYVLCQQQGFQLFYRRKTAYLRENITAIFATGGPFEMFQPLTAQVFGQRLTRVDNHFNSLLSNHNNDPTGAEGESRPVWFEILRTYRQFCDSNRSGAAAQRTRNELNEVTAQLGAVQPALGPGNPARRSEVAAENELQLRGPAHVGEGLQVRAVPPEDDDAPLMDDDNSNGGATENGNSNSSSRRRRVRNASRVVSRNNRQRVSGNNRTIQDDINEGRQNMGMLAESLSNVANAMRDPPQQQNIIPLNQNPIEGLTAISTQMRLLGNDLGSPQRRQISQQLVGSWQGLLGRFHEVNGLSPLQRNNTRDSDDEYD